MKTRTLLLLPVVALVGFLAIKPPAVGTTAISDASLQAQLTATEITSAPIKESVPRSAPTPGEKSASLTASSAPSSDSTMTQSPQPLSANPTTASIAPPVIPGGDDDDDDDDDDHRGHHDDDDDDDDEEDD